MKVEQTLAPHVARLADFVHRIRLEHLPDTVVQHTLLIIRDLLGVILAGSTLPDLRGVQRLALSFGATGRSTVIGTPIQTRAEFAAFANAAASVSLELAESSMLTPTHPGAHVLPAALAVAEETGATGANFLGAFVAGYEVAVRVGRATHLRHAVHPFGTSAIVGAAAAAARLRGLDPDGIADSLEMAAGMAIASSQTAANSGASVRNAVTGLASQNGVLATALVAAGLTPEHGAFEVVFGRILGEEFDHALLSENLGSEYLIERNAFKIHACSRWNHPAIEAAITALEGRTLLPEDVDKVTVWTYYPATRLDWQEPVNGFAAKHSIPYNMAVRIAAGTNDMSVYTDRYVHDPDIRALARRTVIREEPEFTRAYPEMRAARVEIQLRTGETVAATCDKAPGEFDNPFPAEVLTGKFRTLSGLVLDGKKVSDLESQIWSLPTSQDVKSLGCLLHA